MFCLIAAGVLASCHTATAPLPGDVTLTPAKTNYAPSEPVTARLSNRSSTQIGYGACALRAEHHNGDQWELVGPASVGCTMQLLVLDARADRTLQLRIYPPTQPGEYRLVFWYAPRTTPPDQPIYSQPFTVAASN